jgi:hypothetical protein
MKFNISGALQLREKGWQNTPYEDMHVRLRKVRPKHVLAVKFRLNSHFHVSWHKKTCLAIFIAGRVEPNEPARFYYGKWDSA